MAQQDIGSLESEIDTIGKKIYNIGRRIEDKLDENDLLDR
jgi:hypothetical protein